jgi:hypothetical protein
VNATFLNVCEPLGYAAVHDRLWREGDFSTLNPGLQEIAYVEANPLADIFAG